MNQITFKLFLFLVIFSLHTTYSQVVSSKVVDSTTQRPIPYATIQLNKSGMITNEEGRFSFLFNKNIKTTDSLIISCIGFETIAKPLNQFKDSVIYLMPRTIELDEVILTNKQHTVDEIIDKVKENIDKNYNVDLTKKKIFFRESNHQNLTKTDFTFKKSTINALSENFLDSVMQSIPKNNSYYTEILCDLYGNTTEEKQKINLIKASELYDKNNEIGLIALEEKFQKIIEENVKSDSYFKVKSGIFGQKLDMDEFVGDEIDSTDAEALKKKLEEEKKRKKDRKANFSKYRKRSLANMMEDLFFLKKSKLNFINKSGRYEFKRLDLTYLGNDPVYVIEFEPKGSADYRGRLYINFDDFAIIRLDYENVKSIKSFKLLGLSFNVFLSKGKMFFSKGNDGQYSLKYLEKENASKFGIKRPLKIIEKNKNAKGRRKQNELFVKLDMALSGVNKHEVVVFDTQPVTTLEFENFQENNSLLPTYMPNYDPEFWKGYNIIEPNKAIREFTAIE